MASRLTLSVLNIALVMFAIISAVALGFSVIAPVLGEPMSVGFSAVIPLDMASAPIVFQRSEAITPTLQNARADFTLALEGALPYAFRICETLIFAGFWLSILSLLKVCGREVLSERPFTPRSLRALNLISVLLILFPIWQLIRALVWQALILTHLDTPHPFIGMFAKSTDPEHIRMLADGDWGFMIVGFIVLVIAQGFRTGQSIQRDSDEII